MPQQTDPLNDWLGKTSCCRGLISVEHAQAVAATLDIDPAGYSSNSELPSLWHWCFLHSPDLQSDLGEDGHARRGGFLPPVSLPRRMWAGSRIEFVSPILIGAETVKQSSIESIERKSGKSGELVFVTVEHRILQNDQLCLAEQQDIVFRAATPAQATREEKAGAHSGHPASEKQSQATFTREFSADTTLLFRYSALTFNSHRIHYDREYCIDKENYPGLLVHGPLLATLLAEFLREIKPDIVLQRFRFRAMAPVFDLTPFTLNMKETSQNEHELWISNAANTICLQAVANAAD